MESIYTKGNNNVAVGREALAAQNFTTATDSLNVAVGYNCLNDQTTAVQNSAMGNEAGGAITEGSYNITIGNAAANHDNPLTTGSGNNIIGAYADTSAAAAVGQNVLGYNVTSTGNNNFTFGYGTTDSNIAHGATSISAPSDERYKEEIETSTAGLSFINDLRPVTFKWKKEKEVPSDHKAYVADSDERVMGRGEKIQHGFVAQEVKAVIDNHSEIKDGFEMWSQDGGENGRQRLADGELIPMLTKAIQELSAKNDALEARIKTLEDA